jgi:exonuclease SbcC
VLSASLTERKKSRSTDIELLPPAFSPGPEGVELDSARRALKKALDEAGRVQKGLEDANDAIATAASKLTEIEKKRTIAVVAPRSALYGRLNHIGSLLNIAAMPDDDAAQKTWATDIVTKAKKEIQLLQKRFADSKADLDKHSAARRRLAEDLGDEPQAAFTTASIQLRDAENRLEGAQHAVVRVAKISTKIGKLEPARLGLEILRDELGARRFAKYATEKRQERLLEEGTAIFMDITGGRYAFTRDFQIWDHVTNEGRPPQTLSGGEKFLASLALSLAVVEIAANAGAKIESLFLDEGFASLDVDTLEMAMMELRKRSKAGRSICVISHLSQVTKFVTDTFLVKAREEGSEVQHIEGPIDDDADMIEGLVTQLVTA